MSNQARRGRGRQGTTEATQGRAVTDDGVGLYYQTRGAGPPLLLVQGGLSEAGATDQLAAALAAEFLVISYDRRGLSRSSAPLRDGGSVDIDRHTLDAATVLDAVTDRPAHVLGASIGALISLHLAARWPDLLDTVIAHEPPLATVVCDPIREQGLDRVAALAEHDLQAAIAQMGALIGKPPAAEPDARPSAPIGDMAANLRWFFNHDFPAVRASTLTAQQVVAAGNSVRVILTGGRESREGWEYRCARALATALGRELVEFRGGHNAMVSHPWAVAEQVRTILAGPR